MKRVVVILVALSALAPRTGLAQSVEVTAVAGQATDTRGISSSALTLAPAVVFQPGPSTRITLGGGGTRFDTGAWSLQGFGEVRGRVMLSRQVDLTMDARGSAITTSYETRWLTGGLVPGLAFSSGPLHLHGGARVGAARISTAVASPGPLPRTGQVVTSRTGTGLLFGGSVDLLRTREGALALRYDEDHWNVEDVRQVSRRAGLGFLGRRVAVGGYVGNVNTGGKDRRLLGGNFIVSLHRALALVVSAEQYGPDALTGNVAGSTISAGLRLSLGGGGVPRLPAPKGAPSPAPGHVRVSIRAPGAVTVALAGDWNHWQPVPTHRASNGVWYADLRLPPGEYRYAFLIDGSEWRVPGAAPSSGDAFGTRSAWLTVTGARDSSNTSTN